MWGGVLRVNLLLVRLKLITVCACLLVCCHTVLHEACTWPWGWHSKTFVFYLLDSLHCCLNAGKSGRRSLSVWPSSPWCVHKAHRCGCELNVAIFLARLDHKCSSSGSFDCFYTRLLFGRG